MSNIAMSMPSASTQDGQRHNDDKINDGRLQAVVDPVGFDTNLIGKIHSATLRDIYKAADTDGPAPEIAAGRVTDARHLVLDRAAADFWASAHGRTVDEEYADNVFTTAIFMIGEAMRLADNKNDAACAFVSAICMSAEV